MVPALPLPLHSTEEITGFVMDTGRAADIDVSVVVSGRRIRPYAQGVSAAPPKAGGGGSLGDSVAGSRLVADLCLTMLSLCSPDVCRPVVQNALMCGCLMPAHVSMPHVTMLFPCCVGKGATLLLPSLAEFTSVSISNGLSVPLESLSWHAGRIAFTSVAVCHMQV